jgi:hypothetical protein
MVSATLSGSFSWRWPFAVFTLVAYADGTMSSAERRAFASIAADVSAQADRPQDELVREVMGQISRECDQIMGRLDVAMGEGVPWVLPAGRTLLDAVSDGDQALAFKETMISMAQTVASAWPRLGRRPPTRNSAASTSSGTCWGSPAHREVLPRSAMVSVPAGGAGGGQPARVPAKTCQASRDLATRLRVM